MCMVPKKNPLSYKRDSLYTYVAYVPLTSRKEVFFASSPTPLLATHSKAPESSALTFLTSRYRLSEVLVDTVLQNGGLSLTFAIAFQSGAAAK